MSATRRGQAALGEARRGWARQGKANTSADQRTRLALPPLEPVAVRRSMVLDGQTKRVHKSFSPAEFKTVELIMVTDLQFGHRQFMEERFAEFQKWVLAEPNRFIFLGGDLVDAATIHSKGSPYENTMPPLLQSLGVIDLLAPLQPRVLGYVGGNHERRGRAAY
jgi:hypothetical protein